jgi:hypothetical protein
MQQQIQAVAVLAHFHYQMTLNLLVLVVQE